MYFKYFGDCLKTLEWAWRLTPEISTLLWLRQEDYYEYKTSLGYRVRLSLKTKQTGWERWLLSTSASCKDPVWLHGPVSPVLPAEDRQTPRAH